MWVFIVVGLLLFFIHGSKQGAKAIKMEMLPQLGPILWGILLPCEDDRFKEFVSARIESSIIGLTPKERERVLADHSSKYEFLCGAVVGAYKSYIKLDPSKKNDFIPLLEKLYLSIPEFMKEYLTISELPDGWATSHNW